jgi:hypothetical protein
VTFRPKPALATRPKALTREGWDNAKRRLTRPPKELPTTAVRSISKASRNAERNWVKKAGE